MKCQKSEQWISDYIDGELSVKKKRKLEKHVISCRSCHCYLEQMNMLHQEIRELDRLETAPEYRRDFSERLEKRLYAEEKKSSARHRGRLSWGLSPAWRWTTAGALATTVIILGIVLFQPKQPAFNPNQIVLSVDDAVKEIFQEIGSNSELEQLFNSLLRASIDSAYQNLEESIEPGIYNNPLLWDDLTLEELQYLEKEIKKEIKSNKIII